MSTDVLSAHATATGTLVNHPARVKSVVVTSGASAGSLVFRDGGASGKVLVTLVTPAAVGFHDVVVPDQGVRFATDVHVTVTDVTAVTVFHG